MAKRGRPSALTSRQATSVFPSPAVGVQSQVHFVRTGAVLLRPGEDSSCAKHRSKDQYRCKVGTDNCHFLQVCPKKRTEGNLQLLHQFAKIERNTSLCPALALFAFPATSRALRCRSRRQSLPRDYDGRRKLALSTIAGLICKGTRAGCGGG